jgi:hypothetical protein
MAMSIRSAAGSSRSLVKVSLSTSFILPCPPGLHKILAARLPRLTTAVEKEEQ